MWSNWFMTYNLIAPFAPGDGITGIIQESWGVFGEALFIAWLLVLPFALMIALSKSFFLVIKSKISSKDDEDRNKINYKEAFKESIKFFFISLLIGAIIFAMGPVLFKIESSGGKLTGGPYFSGFRSFS